MAEPHGWVYTSSAWHRIRWEVIDRDGGRCRALRRNPRTCGRQTGDTNRYGRPVRLEVHHIKPMSQGGAPLDPRNLVTVCSECHARVEHGHFGVAPIFDPAEWGDDLLDLEEWRAYEAAKRAAAA